MYVVAKTAGGNAVRLTPHRFPDGYGLEFRDRLEISETVGGSLPLRVETLDELARLAETDLFVVPFSDPAAEKGEIRRFRLEDIDFPGQARN